MAAASPNPLTPKRTMDDSDIARLEQELVEERQKCHEAVDAALPLATILKEKADALGDSARVRLTTPTRGVRLPERRATPPPASSRNGSGAH